MTETWSYIDTSVNIELLVYLVMNIPGGDEAVSIKLICNNSVIFMF